MWFIILNVELFWSIWNGILLNKYKWEIEKRWWNDEMMNYYENTKLFLLKWWSTSLKEAANPKKSFLINNDESDDS